MCSCLVRREPLRKQRIMPSTATLLVSVETPSCVLCFLRGSVVMTDNTWGAGKLHID